MPNPRSIAFLITDLHLGGSPRMLRDLAIGLHTLNAGEDFTPVVISLKPLPARSFLVDDLRNAGIAVHTLNLESQFQLLTAIPRLARLLNELQPQILFSILIHANTLATLALPFLRRRPKFVQSLHTLQERPAWHWILQGFLTSRCDAMITPSQPILDRLQRFGVVNCGVVIPNGIDVERFANAKAFDSSELPWPANARVVGYVGRFDPVKNLPLLIRSFAQLVHTRQFMCRLALVGYRPEQRVLEELCVALHVAPLVHFPGPTTAPERWYKSFSCHCLPSTAEGFGLTLVEAMAAGIPVVAVRTEVTEGIVRDGVDGLLVRGEEGTLAQALQAVMDETPQTPLGPISPHLAGETTLNYVRRRYSLTEMVEVYSEILKKI